MNDCIQKKIDSDHFISLNLDVKKGEHNVKNKSIYFVVYYGLLQILQTFITEITRLPHFLVTSGPNITIKKYGTESPDFCRIPLIVR